MSAPASISRRIHFGSSPPIRPPEEWEGMAVGRIPRVTRLLALAIRFEELVTGCGWGNSATFSPSPRVQVCLRIQNRYTFANISHFRAGSDFTNNVTS